MNKLFKLSLGIVILLLFQAYLIPDKIRYFHSQTILLAPDKTQAHIIDFKDSLGVDTLFQIRAKEGFPITYFRKIRSNICFDNKCRLLDIVLYWNITGRYLGFELPEGEFLSKTKHEPFNVAEYTSLHEILKDSMSQLRYLPYNAMTPKMDVKSSLVDAVASPTAPEISELVVKGAAYTTYKLWHFVYGITQIEVEKLTMKELSASLLIKILESSSLTDKIWAINRSGNFLINNLELQTKLFEMVNNKDYNLAERVLHVVNFKEKPSDNLQLLLVKKLAESNYSIKKLILDKLKEAPQLNSQTVTDLAHQLKFLNGELVGNVLAIFKKNQVNDVEIGLLVAHLLENNNNFISEKAYSFLKNMSVSDRVIEAQLIKYKSRRDLNQSK